MRVTVRCGCESFDPSFGELSTCTCGHDFEEHGNDGACEGDVSADERSALEDVL